MNMLYKKTEWEGGEHQRRDGKQAIQLQICTLVHCDYTKWQSSHLRRSKAELEPRTGSKNTTDQRWEWPKVQQTDRPDPWWGRTCNWTFCEVASVHLVTRLSVTDTVFVHSDFAGEENYYRQTDSNRKVGGWEPPPSDFSFLPLSLFLLPFYTHKHMQHTHSSLGVSLNLFLMFIEPN